MQLLRLLCLAACMLLQAPAAAAHVKRPWWQRQCPSGPQARQGGARWRCGAWVACGRVAGGWGGWRWREASQFPPTLPRTERACNPWQVPRQICALQVRLPAQRSRRRLPAVARAPAGRLRVRAGAVLADPACCPAAALVVSQPGASLAPLRWCCALIPPPHPTPAPTPPPPAAAARFRRTSLSAPRSSSFSPSTPIPTPHRCCSARSGAPPRLLSCDPPRSRASAARPPLVPCRAAPHSPSPTPAPPACSGTGLRCGNHKDGPWCCPVEPVP